MFNESFDALMEELMKEKLHLLNQKLNEDKKLPVLFSMLVTIFVLLLVFAWKRMYPFGKGSVMMVDLYSQYGPLLYRFYDVVSGHKSIFLDFDILAGSNLFADTINELINPFNYILFLFGRQNLYLALNVLLLAYAAAMAGAATWVLNRFEEKQGSLHCILGTAYALSGYVAYNFQIIKWMYFPVLFPFYVLFLVDMLNGKKGIKYCLLLAYQLALSIQLGFMTLMFSLFAGGMYVWFCLEKEERNERLSRMGVWTLIALGLSGFSLIPMVAVLMESARTGQTSSYFGVMKIHGLDDLFERIYQVANPILIGILLSLGGKAWNLKEKFQDMPARRKWLIALLGFFWITVLVQPSNLIWHLGSYFGFPVRYGYMVLFVNCMLISAWKKAYVEDNDTKKPVWNLILPLVLCLIAVVMTFGREEILTQGFSSLGISILCPKEAVYALVVMILLGVAAFLAKKQLYTGLICVWGILAFVMNMYPPQAPIRGMNEYAYENMNYNSSTERRDFIRVKEVNNEPLNAGLVTDIPTLSGYIPAGYGDYLQTMKELGYRLQRVDLSAEGGSEISDYVLNHAYLLKAKNGIKTDLDVQWIYENGIEVKDILLDARKATIHIGLDDLKSAYGIEEGDVLFLPIATVTGWKLDADYDVKLPENAKQYDKNLFQMCGAFFGVMLDGQSTEIKMHYVAPGVLLGVIVTIIFMIVAVCASFGKWIDSVPLAGLYKVLFVGGTIAFYIIPPIGLVIYMLGKIVGIIPR